MNATSTVMNVRPDRWGPAKIMFLHDHSAGLTAFVVVDNVSCGPSIGGVRMSETVTVEEVARLARSMTLKSAAAGLAHGGGKAGIVASPALPKRDKERLMRCFARAIAGITDYIPGPDMGTDEGCMAWVQEEIGRAVGLPRVLGGIPLDEIGATAYGLAIAAQVAQDFTGLHLDGARIAIQGFGAVGSHAARFFSERGARIVAVSNSRGGTYNSDGLNVEALVEHVKVCRRPILEFSGGDPHPDRTLVAVDCDIWVPAAQADVLDARNVGDLRARLVVPGANIPITLAAERTLHERGVTVIPDFIANAGGVICAAVEYHGGSEGQAFATIEENIARNTRMVLVASTEQKITTRQAARDLALARIEEAALYHR